MLKYQTQHDTLYKWNGKEAPCKSKEGMGFTVDAEKNNSNDVRILLTAEDNAGNVTSMEYSIKIDITKPIINIEYDKNAADSGTFFRESRRANVTVKERNFDDSLVNITLRATDDGADIALPTVSGWTSSGDRHTATIAYQRDGLYTFDIDVTDKAGNTSADFTEQTFYVDTTAPTLEITGVADRSANNGDIIPVVSYSDTNYDDAQVTLGNERA